MYEHGFGLSKYPTSKGHLRRRNNEWNEWKKDDDGTFGIVVKQANQGYYRFQMCEDYADAEIHPNELPESRKMEAFKGKDIMDTDAERWLKDKSVDNEYIWCVDHSVGWLKPFHHHGTDHG